jgi:hypothetical protein
LPGEFASKHALDAGAFAPGPPHRKLSGTLPAGRACLNSSLAPTKVVAAIEGAAAIRRPQAGTGAADPVTVHAQGARD